MRPPRPPLPGWCSECLCEDSISASRQLRSHRSKLPKRANPQRSTAPLRLSPPHPGYFLLTHASVCRLHFDAASGGSLKCKMVNKCALMGNTFISLTPICAGWGACFQRSCGVIGARGSVAALSDGLTRRRPT